MPGTVIYEVDGKTFTGELGQEVSIGTINSTSGTILINSIGGIPEKFKVTFQQSNIFHKDLIEDTIDYRGAGLQQYVAFTNDGEVEMLPPGAYTIKVSETDEYGNVNPMDNKRIDSVMDSANLLQSGGKYSFILERDSQPFVSESQIPGCLWLIMDKEGKGVRNEVYPYTSGDITGVMLYSAPDTDFSRIGGEFRDVFVRGEQGDGGSGAVQRLHFLADHRDEYLMYTTHIEKK